MIFGLVENPRAPAGVGPPSVFLVPMEAGDSGLDLTKLLSVTLNVQRGDRSVVTWTASVVQSTPPSAPGGSTAIASYPIQPADTSPGGNNILGVYRVEPIGNFSNGSIPFEPVYLAVTSPYDR